MKKIRVEQRGLVNQRQREKAIRTNGEGTEMFF